MEKQLEQLTSKGSAARIRAALNLDSLFRRAGFRTANAREQTHDIQRKLWFEPHFELGGNVKKEKRLEQLIPKGSTALHIYGEGDFVAAVWKHFATSIYGITCSGHLDASAWDDEGDRVRALARALREVRDAQAKRFLLDMRALQAIDEPGLELLRRFHARLNGHAACALVRKGFAVSASLAVELEGCYVAETVSAAIAWLQDKDADG